VIVEQAHMAQVRVAAHAENLRSILGALHAGVDSIEHGSELNQEAIEYMKAHRVYLVPTVSIFENLLRAANGEPSDYPDYILRKGKELAPTHIASFKMARDRVARQERDDSAAGAHQRDEEQCGAARSRNATGRAGNRNGRNTHCARR
jgi:imidazolonepropionase-like amidohydrolase